MDRARATLRTWCAWCALVLMTLPAHATIIGVAANSVYRIDETTGSVLLLNANPGQSAGLQAMARNSAGVLYASGIQPFQHIWTVDPVTGAITQGAFAPGTSQTRGLAFNSADVLYGIEGNPSNALPYTLVTIDVVTGVVTTVGLVNANVQGLEFSAGGTLYGWDIGGAGLITINPATGAVTDVDPSIGGGPEVQTLAFSPGGVLYGAGPANLYTIDTTTGALTLIAAFNPATGIFGMEFVAGAPPGGPVVSLTPPSLAFGTLLVGTTSPPQALTLHNTGTGVLNIASIAASGDFAQTNTCGATLAALASCVINVTFTPTAPGARSGAVTVTSNAPGSPHASTLSGTGTAAPPPPPPPPAPSQPIPTLSQWTLFVLALFVAGLAVTPLRRRR